MGKSGDNSLEVPVLHNVSKPATKCFLGTRMHRCFLELSQRRNKNRYNRYTTEEINIGKVQLGFYVRQMSTSISYKAIINKSTKVQSYSGVFLGKSCAHAVNAHLASTRDICLTSSIKNKQQISKSTATEPKQSRHATVGGGKAMATANGRCRLCSCLKAFQISNVITAECL